MSNLIKWSELSRKLSGSDNSVRPNKVPTKYQRKVNRLLWLLDLWEQEINMSEVKEYQIEHQIEIDHEEDELLGYECMGCGNIQEHESGFGCDKCTGHCLEPWYG